MLFAGSLVSVLSATVLVSFGLSVSGHVFSQSFAGSMTILDIRFGGADEVMEIRTDTSVAWLVELIAFNSNSGASPALKAWFPAAVSVNCTPWEISLGCAIVTVALSPPFPAFRKPGRNSATVNVAVTSAAEPMAAKLFVFIMIAFRLFFTVCFDVDCFNVCAILNPKAAKVVSSA